MASLEMAGGQVWPTITKVCQGRGPRMAAIAYLGWQAPQLLPLKKGDVLVVNVSDAALLTHATSPEALRTYVDAGVQVSSVPSLHAKVLVTATKAVIGSANASSHSGSSNACAARSNGAGLTSARVPEDDERHDGHDTAVAMRWAAVPSASVSPGWPCA
jgi:hypothetical protein